jgi:hypothetical protein
MRHLSKIGVADARTHGDYSLFGYKIAVNGGGLSLAALDLQPKAI